MANGKEPYCGTCKYFKNRASPNDPYPTVIKHTPRDNMCILHNTYLPFDQTEELIICPFWKHYKTSRTFSFCHSLGIKRYKKIKSLYIYPHMYNEKYKRFCDIHNLPKLSEEDIKAYQEK